jgi:hypothetical protein
MIIFNNFVLLFLLIALSGCEQTNNTNNLVKEYDAAKVQVLTWNFDTTATIRVYDGNNFVYEIVKNAKKPYNWEINRMKLIPNKTYTIRYYNDSDATLQKYIKEDFYILQDLNITFPNGGESVQYSGINIQWKFTKSDWKTPVRIELWKGDTLFQKITDYADNQLYTWKLIQIPDAANYRLKIIKLNDDKEYDFSDGNFSFGYGDAVPEITVKYPNGGEKIYKSGVNIKWEWKNKDWQSPVNIELWKNEQFYSTIVNNATNQQYTWISINAPKGDDYKIKIIASDNKDIFDFSDNNFQIIE